jgi:hypothetical protein
MWGSGHQRNELVGGVCGVQNRRRLHGSHSESEKRFYHAFPLAITDSTFKGANVVEQVKPVVKPIVKRSVGRIVP